MRDSIVRSLRRALPVGPPQFAGRTAWQIEGTEPIISRTFRTPRRHNPLAAVKVNLPELGGPSPHIELVEMLDRTLNQFSMQISDEQFAVRLDGTVLFSVLQLSYGEQRTALPTMLLIPVPHRCKKLSYTPVIE